MIKSLYFTVGQAQIGSESKRSLLGDEYEIEFNASLPGLMFGLLDDLKRPIVLKLYFYTGEVLVAGGKNKRFRLSYRGKIGDSRENSVYAKYTDRIDLLQWE